MADSRPEWTATETAVLARAAAMVIPADPVSGLPGADDPAILADLLREVQKDRAELAPLLADVARGAAADAIRARHPAIARLFQMRVAFAYYRDPRVLQALGMPARPPFPRGYDLPPNDLSLLDPVRARGPIWRDPDAVTPPSDDGE